MLSTNTGCNGAAQGAHTVVYGMILGALLLLVVQRYTTLEKQRVLKQAHDFHKGA